MSASTLSDALKRFESRYQTLSKSTDDLIAVTLRLIEVCEQVKIDDPLLAYDLRSAVDDCNRSINEVPE